MSKQTATRWDVPIYLSKDEEKMLTEQFGPGVPIADILRGCLRAVVDRREVMGQACDYVRGFTDASRKRD